MKMKSMVLMAVALGCGLIAMLGVQQALSGGHKPTENKVQVLVAITEVPPGAPLDETTVAFKDWPKESVPEGAVTTKEQYEERALRVRAFPGQMILQPQLGEKGVFNVSLEIPEGMRVVTVAVTLTMIHSGLMMPGDRVDVLVTYKMNQRGAGQTTRTQTVLEFIQVFATDSLRVGSDPDLEEVQAKNISLLVTPDQAALLKHAEKLGALHLTLRNKTDKEAVNPAHVDDTRFGGLSAVFGEEHENPLPPIRDPEPQPAPTFTEYVTNGPAEPQAPVEPEKQTWKVRIFVGEEERIQELELPEEPSLEPAEAQASVTAGNPLMSTIQRFFGGRTGAATSETNPTQGTAKSAGPGPDQPDDPSKNP